VEKFKEVTEPNRTIVGIQGKMIKSHSSQANETVDMGKCFDPPSEGVEKYRQKEESIVWKGEGKRERIHRSFKKIWQPVKRSMKILRRGYPFLG